MTKLEKYERMMKTSIKYLNRHKKEIVNGMDERDGSKGETFIVYDMSNKLFFIAIPATMYKSVSGCLSKYDAETRL